jgi:hypothetical protein
MFKGLINEAKSAAGAMIGKYLARASVAVPFVIALGFATAAITLMLVERFGAITAYFTVAAAFTAVGLIAAIAVTVKEQEEEMAEAEAEQADTSGVASDAAAQALAQAPLALLGALLAPGGPASAFGIPRTLGRNLPLVALLVLIAALFWPSPGEAASTDAEEAADAAGNADEPGRPNGAHAPASAEAMA